MALKRAGGRLDPHNHQQAILTCYLGPIFSDFFQKWHLQAGTTPIVSATAGPLPLELGWGMVAQA